MAIIRKYLTKNNYTKADNNILNNKHLSDQAKLLYWFIASHKNAFQLNDGFIVDGLNWSRAKVTRYKTELQKWGFILVDKIDRSTYFMYVGSSEKSAEQVKKEWSELEKIKD